MSQIAEADLHAYADGMLDQGKRAGVEAYLAEHPEEQERVDAWRELNAALRAFCNPVLEEPIPDRLRVRHFSAMPRYVAAASIAMVGILAGAT
jgi:anti-sigma factor RsiW